MLSRPDRLQRERAMLLVIDVQTKLLPHVEDSELVVAATTALLEGAALFGLPTVATVQYVAGLGPTDPRLTSILDRIGVAPIEKMSFSVCGDDRCVDRIKNLARPQVLIAGIEGHVCVQQTVLDLLAMELQPVVCADAVSSRFPLDVDLAMARMQQAGATITTTEAALFELCGVSGTPEFKALLKLVKALDQPRL